jgi:2-deoxy-D-gluconate 3-dehydrogenase
VILNPSPDLRGHKVLVLGAERRVAGAVAFGFAEAGADVALAAAGDPAGIAVVDRLAGSIVNLGRRAITRPAGFSDDAVADMVADANRELGPFDTMVVAVEQWQDLPTADLGGAQIARLSGANLGALLSACTAFAGALRGQETARGPARLILLLPNVEAKAPAAYVAIRVAVASLVPALAREWAQLPLTVHGISLPAGLDTEAGGAETAKVALRLASTEGDEKNGRVLKVGAFR